MALTNKLTNIAEAIRNKTGKTDLLTLEQMPTEIASIQGGGGSDSTFAAYLNGETTEIYDSGVTSVRDYAFYTGAYNDTVLTLRKVNFPNATAIGSSAFYNQYVASYILPNVKSVGNNAFYSNRGLKEISLPSIETIGNSAMAASSTSGVYATILTKVDLGDKLKTIGSSAFSSNSKLAIVIVRATTPPTLSNSNAFTSTVASSDGAIYVPAASVDTYKSATNWSTYKKYIKAIEDYPEICGEVA